MQPTPPRAESRDAEPAALEMDDEAADDSVDIASGIPDNDVF